MKMIYNTVIGRARYEVDKEIKVVSKRELYPISLFYDKSNNAIWNRTYLEQLKIEKRILDFCSQNYQEQFEGYIKRFRDIEKRIKVLENTKKCMRDLNINELKNIIDKDSPLDDFLVKPIKVSTLKNLINEVSSHSSHA